MATASSTRIFTPTERAKAARRTERIRTATYAKRFAAKEAASKALGTGFRAGVFWRDLGVVNLPSGQPTLRLTGGAAARLAAITPPGHRCRGRADHDRRIPLRVCAGDHFGRAGEGGGLSDATRCRSRDAGSDGGRVAARWLRLRPL